MESVLASLPAGGRVAVVRLRSLGDCVLTTPALDILKQFRPDLRVAVVVEDRFRAVFEGNPDVDEILPPESGALRRFRADLAINFHGGTRSAWMTALSGARHRAGFGHYRLQFPYTVRIPRAQEILGVEGKVHTAEHLASAMFWLGAPRVEIPRAKLAAGTEEGAGGRGPGAGAALRAGGALRASGVAVIHGVAAATEKAWPVERFLRVAAHLRSTGVEPVFVGAASDDLSAFRAYRVQQATLSELKALLAGATLFVGNDSGPAHMAAAFGLPVVVFFGPSDRPVWAPWRTVSQVLPMSASADDAIAALARLRVAA